MGDESDIDNTACQQISMFGHFRDGEHLPSHIHGGPGGGKSENSGSYLKLSRVLKPHDQYSNL